MTPVAIGDIQRTQGTLKTVYNAKKTVRDTCTVSTPAHFLNINNTS